MDRDTYVGIYGIDAGKVIEDYNCKICERRIKCEGRSLNSHMRNCHKIGILEYSKRYEAEKHYNGDQDDPNYYNQAYEIEMDNSEIENDQGLMEYQEGEEEEMDDSLDPLSNYVSAELNDDGDDTNNDDTNNDDNINDNTNNDDNINDDTNIDDNELNQEDDSSEEVDESLEVRREGIEDMTTEESQYFNFSTEDDEEIQNESGEDDMEIKPDIYDNEDDESHTDEHTIVPDVEQLTADTDQETDQN